MPSELPDKQLKILNRLYSARLRYLHPSNGGEMHDGLMWGFFNGNSLKALERRGYIKKHKRFEYSDGSGGYPVTITGLGCFAIGRLLPPFPPIMDKYYILDMRENRRAWFWERGDGLPLNKRSIHAITFDPVAHGDVIAGIDRLRNMGAGVQYLENVTAYVKTAPPAVYQAGYVAALVTYPGVG